MSLFSLLLFVMKSKKDKYVKGRILIRTLNLSIKMSTTIQKIHINIQVDFLPRVCLVVTLKNLNKADF